MNLGKDIVPIHFSDLEDFVLKKKYTEMEIKEMTWLKQLYLEKTLHYWSHILWKADIVWSFKQRSIPCTLKLYKFKFLLKILILFLEWNVKKFIFYLLLLIFKKCLLHFFDQETPSAA